MNIAAKVVLLIVLLLVCAETMLVGFCSALYLHERGHLREVAQTTAIIESGTASPLSRLRGQALLGAAVILAVATVCGFFLAETIAAPVRELLAAVTHVRRGNFRVRLPARGSDELAHLGSAFNAMAGNLEEREKYRATLSKFHEERLVEKLLAGKLRLGGELQRAVILFVDLRGFTTFTEGAAPEEVVRTLNEYLSMVVDAIHAHGGLVDKFLGDGVLAVWGVPDASPDDAVRSLQACLALREQVSRLNEARRQRGEVTLELGMGLNAGEVVAGNIGSRERMEYTVIGDAVNVAARIEACTKEYGTDLLVAKSVIDQTRGPANAFSYRSCGAVPLRGKRKAITLYEVSTYSPKHAQY